MFWILLLVLVALGVAFYFCYWKNYVGPEKVGMVTRHVGRSLTKDVIALSGEAGWQTELLLPGRHLIIPLIESFTCYPRVRVPVGTYGLIISQVGGEIRKVFSRFKFPRVEQDGEKVPDFSILSDPRRFVALGGTKGALLEVLPPGWTGVVHPGAFLVITTEGVFGNPVGPAQTQSVEDFLAGFGMTKDDLKLTIIPAKQYGMVEARDGEPSSSGSIATFPARCEETSKKGMRPEEVFELKQDYSDPHAFLEQKGYAGHQAIPLPPGTHPINRGLFKVTLDDVTVVGPNQVLVITQKADSLPEYSENPFSSQGKNEKLVSPGQRGVWDKTLGPGAYVIDTRAFGTEPVHTSVLEGGALKNPDSIPEKIDFTLKPFETISFDHVSMTIYFLALIKIKSEEAPLFVVKTGGEKRFFTSILPALLRDALRATTQQMKAAEIVQKREELIKSVEEKLKENLGEYEVILNRFILGDIDFLEDEVSKTIRDRAVAEQRIETLRQEAAAEKARIKRDKNAGRADGERERERLTLITEVLGPVGTTAVEIASKGQSPIPRTLVVGKTDAGIAGVTIGAVAANTKDSQEEKKEGGGDENH